MEAPVFGSGSYRYQVVDGFFKRPRKWPFVEVTDVAVDKDDNVYVFNRGPYAAVMIFDRDGNYLDGWGRIGSDFKMPHGITIAPNGDVFTADTDDHTVRRWTKEGKLLLTLGRPNRNAPEQSGEPFNRPTHLTVASNDDLYATDGYGNSHVHVFDPYGKHKFSWGGYGSAPGQFDCIHSVFIDYEDGDKLYIADRWNNRVQIFTPDGQLIGEWGSLHMPNHVRKGPSGEFVVAELHHRVSILNQEGSVLSRWGDEGVQFPDNTFGGGLPTSPARNPLLKGTVVHEPGPGLFCVPHGIAVDSRGSIYVADVAESAMGTDRGSRSVQKFVRVP